MREGEKVDLSIVIVSWNTRDLLRECIESVCRHTKGVTIEVFVVDNASSDGSAKMVAETFPEVKLIANEVNAGFSKANNQAIRLSVGRYVALLNPDTLLIEDVFSPLVKFADENVGVGAIGPKILNADGKTIQYSCARRLPNLFFDFCRLSGLSRRFGKSRLFGGEYMGYWDHSDSRFVEALSGACMLVRKDAIDRVGMLDENQFMYGDEIDWCKRLRGAGYDVYYLSALSIIHYGGESAKFNAVLTSVSAERSRLYYYQKHRGRGYSLSFNILVCVLASMKLLWAVGRRNNTGTRGNDTQIYRETVRWSIGAMMGGR